MSSSADVTVSRDQYSFDVNLYADDIDPLLQEAAREVTDGLFGEGTYDTAMSSRSSRDNAVTKVLKAVKQSWADEATAKLEEVLSELESLLAAAAEQDHSIDWEQSKRAARQKHTVPEKPEEPTLKEIPPQPNPNEDRFQPDLTLLDRIIPSRKRRKQAEMQNIFRGAFARWKQKKDKIEAENERRRQEYEAALDEWAAKREKVRRQREEAAKRVEQLREKYLAGEKEAVEKVMSTVLAQSEYPLDDMFEGEPEVSYNPEAKLLVVDHPIPAPDDIPRREAIKYVKTRDTFKAKELSKRNFKKLYESIPYQIALRAMYELFDGDEAEVVDNAVFNGWVTSVNPATGHEQGEA